MIPQMSIVTLLVIAAAVLALFVIVKKFTLPGAFFENQKTREAMLKEKMKQQELDRQLNRLTTDSVNEQQSKGQETSSG